MPKYKIIVELNIEFATREQAEDAYNRQFTGNGDHSVRIVNEKGDTVEGPKSWQYHNDRLGQREPKSLSRFDD